MSTEIRDLKAMVLAAGVGSRMDPLTRNCVKPLAPIANRPVMEHILLLLKKHGVSSIVSNLHHLPQQVPEYFGNGDSLELDITYCEERVLSGDAGGVRACRSYFENGGTFIVVMGDLITDADLTYVLNQHKAKGAVATIALQKVPDVSRFGVAVLNDDGLITAFQEKPKQEEAISDLASTGIYILEPEVFKHMPADGELSFGKQLFPNLVAKGLPVLGVQVFGYWSDIGTLKDYKKANRDALAGLIDLNVPGVRTEFGWMGSGSSIGKGCRVDGTVLIGRNSHIDAGVKLTGSVIIGDNCYVGAGSRIEDSVIWSGTTLGANANVEDSIIGNGCDIPANMDIVCEATIEPRRIVVGGAAFEDRRRLVNSPIRQNRAS